MFDQSIRPASMLTGGVDVDGLVAKIPRGYTVKGMFVSRFVDVLDSEFSALAPKLIEPPRAGRYLAFKDYPQADYTRIVAAAAAKKFPDLPLREAVRRIARDDLTTFARSMFGKVLLAVIGDAHSTLKLFPDAYSRIAPGPTVECLDLDPRTLRIIFTRMRGILEYPLGQLEGIVMSFQRAPIVTMRRVGPESIAFDVVHTSR